MKVLGIVCSPREGGNTEIMVREALASARNYGAETEFWTVANKDLKPCDACLTCLESRQCHIEDDMQELYTKVLAADGLIFGSPVYFRALTAHAKIVIDRLYLLYMQDQLVNKVAGVVVVAQSIGHDGAFDPFNRFIRLSHMVPADDVWGFGVYEGDIKEYKFGMKGSEELGKQVVTLIKKQFQCPEENTKYIYRIVKDEYGIDSQPTLPGGKREK